MTLFIACILIYHLNMGELWYLVAGGIWVMRLATLAACAQ